MMSSVHARNTPMRRLVTDVSRSLVCVCVCVCVCVTRVCCSKPAELIEVPFLRLTG